MVEGWIKPSLFDGIPNGDMLVGGLLLVGHWVVLGELCACEFSKKKKCACKVLILCGVVLQDGTRVQLRSVVLNKYVSAANGGGSNLTVDRDVASTWETFKVRSYSC